MTRVIRLPAHRRPLRGCFLPSRFRNIGQPADWIVADIVRIEDGVLAEHWDVIQDEAIAEESRSGLPMFGDAFPTRC